LTETTEVCYYADHVEKQEGKDVMMTTFAAYGWWWRKSMKEKSAVA